MSSIEQNAFRLLMIAGDMGGEDVPNPAVKEKAGLSDRDLQIASEYLVEYNYIHDHPAAFNLTLRGRLKYEDLVESSRKAEEQPKVFVVHGRNLKARDAMFDFLNSIGVKPLEWSQAKKATGKPSPHISEILDTAFHDSSSCGCTIHAR